MKFYTSFFKVQLSTVILLMFSLSTLAQVKKAVIFEPLGSVEYNIKSIVYEEIISNARTYGDISIIEKQEVNKTLADNNFRFDLTTENSKICDICKLLYARYVFVITVVEEGKKNVKISCKVIDVLTANILRQNSIQTRSGQNDLVSVSRQLIREILDSMETIFKQKDNIPAGKTENDPQKEKDLLADFLAVSKDDDNSKIQVQKEKELAEAKAKERELAEAQAKKEKELAEAKARERELAEAKARERELAEAQAKKEKELAEAKAREQELAEAQAKREKEFAEAQAKRERELAETQAQKEKELAEAQAQKEKELAEAQAQKEKKLAEVQAQKEKELAEAQAKRERELAKEQAQKEKELAEAQAQKEKEIAEAQAQKEKEIAEAKAQKEKELAEAKAQKEKELAEAKAQKEKELAELKAQKEKELAEIQAQKEKELADAKEKEDKELADAKEKEKELTELKAQKEKELAEAKAQKEKELAEAQAQKDKEIAEAQAQKEKEIAETQAQKEKEIAEALAQKEKELAEALAQKEKEIAEAKAQKEKELAEAKAQKEKELAEAKAQKEKELAEAKAQKEKELAEAKAKEEMLKAEEAKRVMQQKAKLFFDQLPDTVFFSVLGGKEMFTANYYEVSWDEADIPSWYSLQKTNNALILTCKPNDLTSERMANFFIMAGDLSKKIWVKQKGAISLSVSINKIEFESSGGKKEISVNTNASSWEISGNPSWCAVKKNANKITLDCFANETYYKRDYSFEIRAGDKSEKIQILQKESVFLTLSDSIIVFQHNGGSRSLTVNTNVSPWSTSNEIAWCPMSISGNTITFYCKSNLYTQDRNEKFTIFADKVSKTIQIKQKGIPFLEQGNWKQAINRVIYTGGSTYENAVYKGERSSKGIRNGLGAYFFISDNESYWGDFLQGESSGKGIYIIGKDGDFYFSGCPNCKFYVGNWSADLKNGLGRCYDKQGELLYHGYFNNDRPIEKFPQSYDDTHKFESIEYDNGDLYLGETYRGIKHGLGIFFWANGDAWYGEWKDGKKEGNGIEFQRDGAIKAGRWSRDKYLE